MDDYLSEISGKKITEGQVYEINDQPTFNQTTQNESYHELNSEPVFQDTPIQDEYAEYRDYSGYQEYNSPPSDFGGGTRKLESSEIRAYARSDMDFKKATGLILGFMGLSFLLNLLSNGATLLIKDASVLAAISGTLLLLTFVATMIITAGLLKSFLEMRRKERVSGLFGAIDRFPSLLAASLLLALMLIGIILVGCFIGSLLSSIIKGDVGTVLFAMIVIFTIIGALYLSFRYSQASYFTIDGMGPIEALRESRTRMKGNVARYIFSILPILGWMFLLFAVLMVVILIPFVGLLIKQGVSTLGLIVYGINYLVLIIAFQVPIQAYQYMIQAEFYDNLIGNTLNPLNTNTTKKPLLVNGVLAIVLTLCSTIAMMLPIGWIPAYDLAQYLDDLNNTSTLSDIANDNSTPSLNLDIPDDYDTSDTSDTSDTPNTTSTGSLGITYSVPAGYEISDEDDSGAYLYKDSDYIYIYKTEMYSDDLEYLKEYYNAEEKTFNGIKGYYYAMTEGSNSYYFEFIKDGYHYDVHGTNETDLNTLLNSLK